MKKKSVGKIALASARAAIEKVHSTSPPNVSVDKARELLGPDLFRMIKGGWLDEDIIEIFSDQNENDMRSLLEEARRDESQARRTRTKAKLEKKTKRFQSVSPSSATALLRNQSTGPPMLISGRSAALASLALPAPSSPVVAAGSTYQQQTAPVPADASRKVTRNRGIRRSG